MTEKGGTMIDQKAVMNMITGACLMFMLVMGIYIFDQVFFAEKAEPATPAECAFMKSTGTADEEALREAGCYIPPGGWPPQ